MPSGRMRWFDPRTGEGRIESGTRAYPVRAPDIEPAARVAGARVRFDVTREGAVVRASRVRLREGTRVSVRQGRFGDVVGAGREDEAGRRPLTHRRPDRRPTLRLPLDVATAWVLAMQDRDVETAVARYAPHARLHVGSGTLEGHAELRGYLAASPLFGVGTEDVQIRGEADGALIAWHPAGDRPGGETRLRIRHGEIVEQWVVTSG